MALPGQITRLENRKNRPLRLTTADSFICLNAILFCVKYYLYFSVLAISSVYLPIFSYPLYFWISHYTPPCPPPQHHDTDKRNTAGYLPKIYNTGSKIHLGLS